MRLIKFHCFFNSISDFLEVSHIIFFNFDFPTLKYFMLKEPIKLKDKKIPIDLEKAENYFCFSFSDILFNTKKHLRRSNKDIKDAVQRIMKLNYFTDESRNNYICKDEELKHIEKNKYGELNSGIYFYDDIGLIKYAFKHNFIDLESISDDTKSKIENILKIPDSETKILKEQAVKNFSYSQEYIDHFKNNKE